MAKTSSIYSVVHRVTQNLHDRELADAVDRAFATSQTSLDEVEGVFEKLTSQIWPKEKILQFFHAWRDTHLTALSISAISCRMLVLSEQQPEKADLFSQAANENAKIIHEDLGVDGGESHANLYQRLANAVCGDNEWEMLRYQNPAAYNFRKWLHARRVLAPQLEASLLTTIASEIYNHGEYTIALPLFEEWLTRHLKMTAVQAKPALAYIRVHTGITESNHFLHGINALSLYLQATDQKIDYHKIHDYCVEYLERIGTAFASMAQQLGADKHFIAA